MHPQDNPTRAIRVGDSVRYFRINWYPNQLPPKSVNKSLFYQYLKQEFFALADTDGDGALSFEGEWEREYSRFGDPAVSPAVEAFQAHDQDQDGSITLEEFPGSCVCDCRVRLRAVFKTDLAVGRSQSFVFQCR